MFYSKGEGIQNRMIEHMGRLRDIASDSVSLTSVVKLSIGTAITLWGGVPDYGQALFVIMSADFVTGTLAALRNREWEASKAWAGLIRKLGTTVVVLAAVYLSSHMKSRMGVTFNMGEAFAWAFTLTDFGSCLENLPRMGVKLPPLVGQFLIKVRTALGSQGQGQNQA